MSSFTFYAQRPLERYRKSDPLLLVSMILLWGLGMVSVFSFTSGLRIGNLGDSMHFVKRQLLGTVVGLVFMLPFAVLNMKTLRKFIPFLCVFSLVLCCLTFTGLGIHENGATRWIRIGKFSFQPSELAKLVVVLFLANLFEKQKNTQVEEERNFLYPLMGLMTFVTVIVLQKDLSTAVVVLVVGMLMFFVCGADIKMILLTTLFGICAVIILIGTSKYRIERLKTFINPEGFEMTSGFQQRMADLAISDAGFWGKGFGSGLKRLRSIPEIQSDYIFAGWATATGFLGVIFYLGTLFLFCFRGVKTALSCPDQFASYGAMGCVMMIVLQSLLNLAVVSGVVPTTGIPLPFFSHGGSSLVATLGMCGFLINASHCGAPDEYPDNESFFRIKKRRDENVEIESFNGVVVENE